MRPMPLPRPALRALLQKLFRGDADLDEFVGDYFPEVLGRFGDGMDRKRKTNILLEQLADDQRLTDELSRLDSGTQQNDPSVTTPSAPPGRVKILYLAANPTTTTQLDLAREVRGIEERIGIGKPRDALELVVRFAVRRRDLQRALLEEEPHVLHFSGHGSAREQLIFEDDNGNAARVEKEALADLLGDLLGNLRLVVLNACDTESIAEALVAHVDCAIGMHEPIGDQAAIAFAASFYQALGFGKSVDTAFRLGKNELKLARIPEDQTPQLKVKPGVDAAKLVIAGAR
jgi:CHAT domain